MEQILLWRDPFSLNKATLLEYELAMVRLTASFLLLPLAAFPFIP